MSSYVHGDGVLAADSIINHPALVSFLQLTVMWIRDYFFGSEFGTVIAFGSRSESGFGHSTNLYLSSMKFPSNPVIYLTLFKFIKSVNVKYF